MNKLQVMFFSNGNTATFLGDRQQTHLQESWLELFAEFLESKGIDPTEVKYTLPDGKEAAVFKTLMGYNWRIENG